MNILPGLDFLQHDNHTQRLLRAQRIGLVTNHTGQTRDGVSALEVLNSIGANVRALFSPEHGPRGVLEGDIESGKTDDGLMIHSLYGATKRPTAEMLSGLDALIFDIQDVGARFYTYSTTLAYCLEECAAHKIAMIVLDRPNPLGGEKIEGPMLEDECHSFIGHVKLPVVHGLTLGEIARYHAAQNCLDVELHVTEIQGWNRAMRWPQTQLPWIAPSPNLPDFTSAAWYPATCLLEFSHISVGRGTDAPFQIVGAPWMNANRVLECAQSWPDFVRDKISVSKIAFTPTRATHEGVACEGVKFDSENVDDVPLVALGLCLMHALHQTHAEFGTDKLEAARSLIGSHRVLEWLKNGELNAILSHIENDAIEFANARQKFLLY
jgi:uncharacterized protein YbbC (DUF1343 family)